MKPAKFGPCLKQQQVSKLFLNPDSSHLVPNYSNFNGSNHFEKLQG
jgi:hypothetical protein